MAQRTDIREVELDGRAREVLREIVIQYVSGGEPISSRSLARSGRFGLSPASLRNVMADLEDSGFVYQPHTSSGRVPTDRGYRFFIDHLMRNRKPSQHEREVIDENVSRASELDEVMQLGSRILSDLSNQIGLVFLPTLNHLVMRSIDFIAVSDTRIMCVIVGTNGVVVNKIIESRERITREELASIGTYVTTEFHGLPLEIVRSRLLSRLEEERAQYDQFLQRSVALAVGAVDEVLPHEHDLHLEGAASILDKPEFADGAAMRRTFLALQQKEKLIEILNRFVGEEDGVQIVVGSESVFTNSHNLSLVAARYGSGSCPSGLVGILGPTRMEYARLGPLVEYLGKAISRKIEESQQEQSR